MKSINSAAGLLLLAGCLHLSCAQLPTINGFKGVLGQLSVTNRTIHAQAIERELINATCTSHLINTASQDDQNCGELVPGFMEDYEILINFNTFYNASIQQPLLANSTSNQFSALVEQTGISLQLTINALKGMVTAHPALASLPTVEDIIKRNKPYARCFFSDARELYTALWRQSKTLEERYSQLVAKGGC